MSSRHAVLQTVIFKRYEHKTSWQPTSDKSKIGVSTLRHTYARWASECLEPKPLNAVDIHVLPPLRARPSSSTTDEEKVIAKYVHYYAHNNTPLSKTRVLDLAQEHLSILSTETQESIGFFNNRPTNKCLSLFFATEQTGTSAHTSHR